MRKVYPAKMMSARDAHLGMGTSQLAEVGKSLHTPTCEEVKFSGLPEGAPGRILVKR
jgi:hypothetical protein